MVAVAVSRGSGDSDVGARLAAIIAQRGLTLSGLSRASGVSISQLSLLTRGRIDYPRVPTMRKIARALQIDEQELFGLPTRARGRDTHDLYAHEGTRLVELVQIKSSGERLLTGEMVAIASSMLADRGEVQATIVTGSEMAPYVMDGDRVVFDPYEAARDRQMVLVVHQEAVRAAWFMQINGAAHYRLENRGRLVSSEVQYVGTVLYIMRSPPEYHP